MQPTFALGDTVAPAWKPSAPPSLGAAPRVALDLETTGLKWWDGDRPIGISVTSDGGTQYLPFGHHGGGNLDEAVVKRWAQRELRDKHILGLNVRFDLHFLREWGIDLEAQGCTASDVAHSAALLDDHRRYFSLDRLAHDFLGTRKIGMQLDAARMAEYHAGHVAPRAEGDTRLVWELEAALAPRLVEEGLTRVKDLENQVIWVVCEMERNGCPLDEATLDTWLVESDQTYQRILWNIYRDTGLSINPQRPADLVTLCMKLKLPIQHTEDGRASFTDTILDAYQHPVINRVRQARKLASLRSKSLVKYRQAIGADGILRYALHQLRVDTGGTVTGRFSSSALQRGVGVNIQQVPATDLSPDYPIRALHRPASGQWLSADADQIEYRLFANRAKNEEVLAAYQADPYVNFHQVIQDKIRQAHFHVNLSYADVKTMNFCRLYGGGKARIAEMLGMISQEQYQFLKRTNSGSDHPWLDDAAALMRIYDDALPQVTHMLRVASRSAISNGYVATALGRRARLTHQESYKAMNRIIQGTAADVMKEKLVALHAARTSTGFTLRFTVHDEVCGDCPDTDSRRAVHAILNTQDRPLPIPLLWTVRTGASWAACE